MKLWQKIAFIWSAVMLLLVGAVSLSCLGLARESILTVTCQRLEENRQQLSESFLQWQQSMPDNAQDGLLRYGFVRSGGENAILMKGEETLYSCVAVSGAKPLHLSEMENSVCYTADGGSLLLVGGQAGDYRIFVYEDVTRIQEKLTSLTLGFLFIGLLGISGGVLLILLLTRKSMEPLAKLQQAAAQIAGGSYSQRTGIHSTDEVGALAKSFDQMAESIQETIDDLTRTAQRQQRFIHGVTHEFKTPMAGILMNAEAVQNVYMEEEERMEALSRIQREVNRLEKLVQKLLKLITLEQPPEKSTVLLHPFLEELAESAQPMLHGVDLKIQCHTDSLVFDRVLMQSALLNLVENAAKASSPGSAVILTAEPWGFQVADTGIGIPQEELSRITEPFYMVDKSRSKKLGGVGLGLTLASQIVQAHGGHLEISSTPGKGTEIRVVLQ